MYRPVEVTAKIIVNDPDRPCPGYAFGWGDGSSSIEEADCMDAYARPERLVFERKHKYKSPGNFQVVAVLFNTQPDGKVKVWWRDEKTVEIR